MNSIRSALAGAAVLLGMALALAFANRMDWLGDEGSRRASGVFAGVLLVIIGNSIPKQLDPLSRKDCEPTCKQRLQRFAGWTLVLAGLGYAVSWLLAPPEIARGVSLSLGAASVLLVGGRVLWAMRQAGS